MNIAFYAIVGSSVVLQMMTFLMPAALLLYRKRSAIYLPPTRPFALSNVVGYSANIVVVLFALLTIIFFNFPAFLPTTTASMSKLSESI